MNSRNQKPVPSANWTPRQGWEGGFLAPSKRGNEFHKDSSPSGLTCCCCFNLYHLGVFSTFISVKDNRHFSNAS